MTNETANETTTANLKQRNELWRYTVREAHGRRLIDAARAAESAARKLRKLATEDLSDLQRNRVRLDADCELDRARGLLDLDHGRCAMAVQRDGVDPYAQSETTVDDARVLTDCEQLIADASDL
tara:strand:+ start:48 stop:419 length:372 start_codon:yes stop_codon:yes gene_type:complete